MLTFPSAPTITTCGNHRKSSASYESQPSSSDAKTQLTDFSQIPQILRARFQCMTSFTPPGPFPIWGFILTSVNDASSPHACKHLRSCLHVTNPCSKRKVLSLTKPKGKIYKTTSLGLILQMVLSCLKQMNCFIGIHGETDTSCRLLLAM